MLVLVKRSSRLTNCQSALLFVISHIALASMVLITIRIYVVHADSYLLCIPRIMSGLVNNHKSGVALYVMLCIVLHLSTSPCCHFSQIVTGPGHDFKLPTPSDFQQHSGANDL